MNTKDITEEIQSSFNEVFYEGERNAVFCKKHKVLATPNEIKEFVKFMVNKKIQEMKEESINKGFCLLCKADLYK